MVMIDVGVNGGEDVFFSSRRRHTRFDCDWSSDVCSSDLGSNPNQSTGQPQQQDFNQMAAKISAQIDDTQARLDSINKQLATGPRSKRKGLLAQREKLQGALSLNKAVQEAVQKMATFASGTGDSAGEGLEGSINQLAHSVPEVFGKRDDSAQRAPARANTPQPSLANSSGLIGQSITLIGRVRSMHEIDQMVNEADRLRQTTEALRKPLSDNVVAMVQRGRDLANQVESP